MKKLKREELKGSKEKKSYKALKVSLKQKGFTLIELIVSTGIGVLVSLGLAAVFIFSIQQFTIIVEKNQAEENKLWLTYFTRIYLGQAVSVVGTQGVPAAGQLRLNFNIRNLGFNNQQIAPFALFQRENAVAPNNGNPTPELEATGIFVKSANSANLAEDDLYNKSMAVIFDIGCNNGGGGGVCVVNPSRQDLHYDRVSRFEVLTTNAGCLVVETEPPLPGNCLRPGDAMPVVAGGYRVKSVTLAIATRFFDGMIRRNWFYHSGPIWRSGNPAGNIANPANQAQFKDLDTTLKITLRNNVLSDQSLIDNRVGRQERAHGGIYYYFPILPRPVTQ